MSDLDKSNHMTNLRYIDMFQDAYDATFWKMFDPKEMEIAFLSQALEGEELTILSKQNKNEISLAAIHSDGKIASVAMFRNS